MSERDVLKSVYIVRRYHVICDTCSDPEEATHGPLTTSKSDAIYYAKEEGWVVENGYMVCPRCQEQRRIDACAADGGHRWKNMPGLEPGGDGWHYVADGAFGVRDCVTCPFREIHQQGPDLQGDDRS